jgi:predicted transcriptional regulator of viral defense system
MKFSYLLEIVGDEPIFETGLILAGNNSSLSLQRQLSLWVKSGKLYQLRRGVYSLAPPYQKTVPHPFLVANKMVRGSYVSLQSALSYYGLIPEYVAVTMSVTTGRSNQWDTPLGAYAFRHLTRSMFTGYQRVEIITNQHAFVALPEKAILDLVHLTSGGDDANFLAELRLQNLEQLNLDTLNRLASRPKLQRAADWITSNAHIEREAYEKL